MHAARLHGAALPSPTSKLVRRRLCIGGSLIGSIKETQEMLDVCGEKNITCDVEVRFWVRVIRGSCVPQTPVPCWTCAARRTSPATWRCPFF